MADWEVLAQRGAQGLSAQLTDRGTYAPLATYAVGDLVQYAGSTWRAITAGVLGQPDLSPTQWELFAQGGAGGGQVLSEGLVPDAGLSITSAASGTPSYADITGCAVAPNTTSPIDLELTGPLVLNSTQASATNYRVFIQVVDDLGAQAGLLVPRYDLYNNHPIWVVFTGKVKVTPASTARTYKAQAAMTDATGGTAIFGGTVHGGTGNKFRLTARAR